MKLVKRQVGKKIIFYATFMADARAGEGPVARVVRKQVYKSLRTSDKALAQKLFEQMKTEYERTNALRWLGLGASVETVEDLWALFAGSLRAQQLSGSTLEGYQASVARIIEYLIAQHGSASLAHVSAESIEGFLGARLRTTTRRKRDRDGVLSIEQGSPAAADKDMRQLKAVFNWGAGKKHCAAGLFDGLEKMNLRRREPHILTDDQIIALFAAADDLDGKRGAASKRMGLLLRLGYYGGFRSEEIRALKRDRVNLGGGYVQVVNAPEIGFVAKKNKERVVKLLPPVMEMIRTMKPLTSPYLVGYQNPRGWDWISDWAAVRRAAGLDDLGDGRGFEVRQLRHNFALRFLQLTKSDALTRTMMGHASDTDTLIQHYLVEGKFFLYPESGLWDKAWAAQITTAARN